MENYKNGYVAFLDILGFSDYVNSGEVKEISELFKFTNELKTIFDSNTGIEMDFFSDSIILMSSTNSVLSFLLPIYLAETYLMQNLGLLFRGAIVSGEYYHDNNNTFGPAIVKAYRLEEKAKYSRIIIDDSVEISDGNIEVFTDIDGKKCLNTYCNMLWQDIPQDYDGSEYKKEELFIVMINSLKEIRQKILELCDSYWNEELIEKYFWRSVPFNYMCDYISKYPSDVDYISKHYSEFPKDKIEQIKELRINYNVL